MHDRDMMRLYSDLALAYHEIYRSLFDYRGEFDYYHGKLKNLGCARILEIGCGTGHLASRLMEAGYDYTGFDLSPHMLEIARREIPDGSFILGDMRYIRSDEKYQAVLITGRTFIHLTKDEDVHRALDSIRTVIEPEGYLIFDCINSEYMEENFKTEMVSETDAGVRRYRRESRSKRVKGKGFLWEWDALYRIWENGEERQERDIMILRAFNRKELSDFLNHSGFEVVEIERADIDLKTVARVPS
ncbi:MAG: class I SAM-dependent DNA methyltransferase [Thermoplasmatota archaeon]